MAPRAPGVHTHEEWKGMAQPVGLVALRNWTRSDPPQRNLPYGC
jgi:hypothetical protein